MVECGEEFAVADGRVKPGDAVYQVRLGGVRKLTVVGHNSTRPAHLVCEIGGNRSLCPRHELYSSIDGVMKADIERLESEANEHQKAATDLRAKAQLIREILERLLDPNRED